MNRIITKLFSILALLSILLLIFKMSAQNAPASAELSLGFAKLLSDLLGVNITNGMIRTFAHFTEYAVLGFTLANTAFVFNGYLRPVLPAVLGALFAIADEIHQIFVPGRAFQFSDIAVDASGVILGVTLYIVMVLILIKLFRRKKHG